MVLMAGCPRQNSKTALNVLEDVGCMLFRTPACSLDLNFIQFFSGLIPKEFEKQVIY